MEKTDAAKPSHQPWHIAGRGIGNEQCAALVLNAYTMALVTRRNEPKAFDAAIRAWQERNPAAAQGEAGRAVANIICKKL